ncbi:type II toxin-antitoxin system mRNA interferase toxin, RelE/StbE family [Candidatus Poribacteria bacterium]|nr:MAG: type II toxin-antitoxin system mRNA interferase toxin, RelE/StbE family [Candidatus Poribacteria bacterium]
MYRLEIMPKAETALARLDATIEQRVLDKLRALCENCDTHRHEALRDPHRGKFRLRVAGAYRVIYIFNRQTRTVVVHDVGHRSSVY